MTPPSVVVFDCNTILQGLLNGRGPAGACLELFRTGAISLAMSPDVLAEVRGVLNRPELRWKFRRLTSQRVEELLQTLVRTAVLITEVGRHTDFPRDPKDEPYLNLAITAGASHLVTRDRDLLGLMHEESREVVVSFVSGIRA